MALLADAGYGLTLGVAMGPALLATGSDASAGAVRRTSGYQHAEVLASLANALVLWAVAAWILLEAWGRFAEGSDVDGGLLLGVAVIGLAVHFIIMLMLKQPAQEHGSVAHAREHALPSVMGPVAAVLAGLTIQMFGWQAADLACAALIAILALVNTWRLLAHVVHLLREGTPDMDSLLGRIRTIASEEFNIRHVTVQLETTAANWKEEPRVAARLGRRG